MEDISSDETLNGGSTESRPTDLEIIGKPRAFRGQPLWPYTHGVDLIFTQVTDPNDKGVTYWLKFLFLHVQRGGATAVEDRIVHLRPYAWDIGRFQGDFLDWVETLGPIDDKLKLEAKKLFDEMRAEAQSTAVEPLPTGNRRPKKKAAAKSQATPGGSSASSKKSGG